MLYRDKIAAILSAISYFDRGHHLRPITEPLVELVQIMNLFQNYAS